MKKQGLTLKHIIGSKTGHAYTPAAKKEIEEFLATAAEKGRPEYPASIKFTTRFLRYNTCFWLTLTGLDRQWDEATIDASTSADNSPIP